MKKFSYIRLFVIFFNIVLYTQNAKSVCCVDFGKFDDSKVSVRDMLCLSESKLGKTETVKTLLRGLQTTTKENLREHPLKYLCIYDYLINSDTVFANCKSGKAVVSKVLTAMLYTISETDVAIAVFEKFYDLFSGRHAWISESDPKFAAYAMLAYASTATNLSMSDVNLINDLSRLNQESDSDLNVIMQNIVKSAPFLVGVYYDVRPDNDTLILGEAQRKEIIEFLKSRLKEVSETVPPAQGTFRKIILALPTRS